MVLSHLESGRERQNGGIRNFSMAHENYAETFMEDNLCGTISSGQEMTGDIASRDSPRIVDITIRRENGASETYSLESMTKKRCHRLVQDLRDSMPADGQRAGYSGYRTRQARKRPQKTFGFHGQAEAVNGDQDRRDSNSSDNSDGGHAQSDGECGTKDSTRSNRRKRARKSPSEPTSIREGLQRESLVSNPVATTRLSLMIADENAVMAFYRRILADGQQTLCKKLAKWWIRAINPNKQTNYPYAKGPEKKPPWWPQTPPNNAVGVPAKGTTENGFVRHKEPDHLAKPERLTLLPHMLNQVTDPRNRTQFNSIDVTKLHQISMDSINNETTDKDKHESWRRFVNEIFQAARQQERYKDGETDETTVISVLPSYDSWRKGPIDDEEEDSKSDEEYDDGEDNSGNVLAPETLPVLDQDGHIQAQIHPPSLGEDIKQEYSGYVHDHRFRLNFQDGINDQPSYRRVNDVPNQMPNPQSYSPLAAPLPKSYQQPSLVLQEPFRRHSDTAGRFSNQSSFVSFLPITNMAHISNPQYQTLQPVFPFPAIPSSPNCPVLPPPLSAPMVRALADMPHFPASHDTGFFPRSNAAFQTSVRDTILGSHGNLLQLSQQQQNYQDYLHNQDYHHNAPKIHIMNLNSATRPEFTYDQENESNASRSEFSYNAKPRCSVEPVIFDLDEMANGGSNGNGEHVR